MGDVPRPEPILLRRPAYDGPARGGVLHQRDPDHRHQPVVLRVRVSVRPPPSVRGSRGLLRLFSLLLFTTLRRSLLPSR